MSVCLCCVAPGGGGGWGGGDVQGGSWVRWRGGGRKECSWVYMRSHQGMDGALQVLAILQSMPLINIHTSENIKTFTKTLHHLLI